MNVLTRAGALKNVMCIMMSAVFKLPGNYYSCTVASGKQTKENKKQSNDDTQERRRRHRISSSKAIMRIYFVLLLLLGFFLEKSKRESFCLLLLPKEEKSTTIHTVTSWYDCCVDSANLIPRTIKNRASDRARERERESERPTDRSTNRVLFHYMNTYLAPSYSTHTHSRERVVAFIIDLILLHHCQ